MRANRETSPSITNERHGRLIKSLLSLVLCFSVIVLAACSSDAAVDDATEDVATTADSSEAATDVAEEEPDAAADTDDAAAESAAETVERPDPPTDIEVAEFDDRKKPVVPFSGEALSELGIEDVIVGEGREAVSGSFVDVHYVGVLNSTGEQFDASWDRGGAFSFELGAGRVIAGWDEGVVGMREGGRRILRIPAAMAYGDGGSGIITPGSDLVFTVDLATVVETVDPADEPQLTVPDDLSGELEVDDVVEGTGPAAVEGDIVKMHYTSILASTEGPFVSSWQQGGVPVDFLVGEDRGLRGFDESLVGVKAGGTRTVIIPPDFAFGAEGLPGQVEPDETIIFQFDIVSVTAGTLE